MGNTTGVAAEERKEALSTGSFQFWAGKQFFLIR
jgi:hypothetical protein